MITASAKYANISEIRIAPSVNFIPVDELNAALMKNETRIYVWVTLLGVLDIQGMVTFCDTEWYPFIILVNQPSPVTLLHHDVLAFETTVIWSTVVCILTSVCLLKLHKPQIGVSFCSSAGQWPRKVFDNFSEGCWNHYWDLPSGLFFLFLLRISKIRPWLVAFIVWKLMRDVSNTCKVEPRRHHRLCQVWSCLLVHWFFILRKTKAICKFR